MKLMTTTVLSRILGAPRGLKRFRKDDDGGMIIFSLFLFVLILWSGGMAVDLMRFETTRAKLQGTLDRATLAAADLDQTELPPVIVNDYFAKAGMSQFLTDDVEYEIGLNYRTVTVNAAAEMPLFFYDIPRVFTTPFNPGLTTLEVSSVSSAEERVSDVEVSLILDVSTSMSGNRINNLRPAARDFVTTVLGNNTNAPQGLITISMVPYSAVVNPGTTIAPFLNLNRTHMHSACPLFDADEFDNLDLDLSATYNHVSHFDPYWFNDARYANPIKYPWCPVGDENGIVIHSTDEDDLHDAIDDLEPYGNTAIDMGMKWGVALLDPSTQAIVASIAGEPGTGVPEIATGRPEAHGLSDVLKVVVLMTDGQNTSQYDLVEPFKSEISPLWFNRQWATQDLHDVPNNRTSVQYAGESTPNNRWDDWFYWNGYGYSSRYQRYPNGFANRTAYINATPVGPTPVPGDGLAYTNDVYNATWQELYADRVYNRINNTYFSKPYNHGAISWSEYLAADNAINYSVVNGSQADDRLEDLCDTAKACPTVPALRATTLT